VRGTRSRSASVAGRIADAGYALGWLAVRRVPEPVAYAVFALAADVLWWRSAAPVRRLERNLRHVVPGSDEAVVHRLARAGMRSYLRYWCETFRLPVWSREQVVQRVVCEHAERFREPATNGRGVVVALPHSANWDLAGAWAVLTGTPLTTVAERLRPESLFDRFVAYREALGMEVLPLTGGDRGVFLALVERLHAGGLVCLLGDRDLSGSGVTVDFLGAPARMPAGPAALALHTGAALVPASLWFDGPLMRIVIHPEITPPPPGVAVEGAAERAAVMTQALADVFAAGVARHPADWHMLARLWEADRPASDPPRSAPATATQSSSRAGG